MVVSRKHIGRAAIFAMSEMMYGLMLDALRRGILMSRMTPPQWTRDGAPASSLMRGQDRKMNIIEQKRRLCQNVAQLMTHKQKMDVMLAIVRIAGFEAIGKHNNGCLVDITGWDSDKVRYLTDVIQFATK